MDRAQEGENERRGSTGHDRIISPCAQSRVRWKGVNFEEVWSYQYREARVSLSDWNGSHRPRPQSSVVG